MRVLKPFVAVPNDNANRIMARSGNMIGFSKTRVVWRFGFMPDSDAANAYGVSADNFLFVMADYSGKEIDRYTGYAMDLPENFRRVINSSISSEEK